MTLSSAPESSTTLAAVHYGDGDFAVLGSGGIVRCAVSGVDIPLTALRYWSVARQEAYAGPSEYLAAAASD